MRLVKLVVVLVILGLIALFIGQNMSTWTSPLRFSIDLSILGKTETTLELYIVIFASAAIGFLVGILALMKPYFKTRRTLVRERQEKKAGETLPVNESEAKAS